MRKFSDLYFRVIIGNWDDDYYLLIISTQLHGRDKFGWWRHRNDTKCTITRKIKTGEFFNFVFLFIQPIADLSRDVEKKFIDDLIFNSFEKNFRRKKNHPPPPRSPHRRLHTQDPGTLGLRLSLWQVRAQWHS